MAKRAPTRTDHLRSAVAQEAARLMAEHGIQDFHLAKRKAAERYGVVEGAFLPKNTEIEAALASYQRLLAATSMPRACEQRRGGEACDAGEVRTAAGGGGAERNGDRTATYSCMCFRQPEAVYTHLMIGGSSTKCSSGCG
jgi:hypothetical protein